MWIRNVWILTEEGTFKQGAVRISGERIQCIRFCCQNEKDLLENMASGGYMVDGGGGFLFPGMIDMHLHGAVDADFCDGTPEALGRMAEYEASIGVTAIAPATMTLPEDRLLQILANAREFQKQQAARQSWKQAELVGINMEGPFISPLKKGAQDAAYILPRSSTTYKKFQEAAGGLVRVVAIAPEEPAEESVGEFIRAVKSTVEVSLAHTNADYASAWDAFERGASHAVHLFNAMPGLGHRNPGAAGAALDRKEVTVELICDGVHIHPAVIRMVFAIKESGKIILVSDSMRATGLSDGNYMLGGQEVNVHGNRASLMRDGSLAGSVTTLPDCVRYAAGQADIPLGKALLAATLAPAKRLGLEKDYGTVAEGKLADLVIWDREWETTLVVHRGRIIHSR